MFNADPWDGAMSIHEIPEAECAMYEKLLLLKQKGFFHARGFSFAEKCGIVVTIINDKTYMVQGGKVCDGALCMGWRK